ncbi:hypothetical protein [Streptomyces sp. NPDC014623]|uniref:hypothetical protein n=1 Tax=Streptomyces sp. NPDC014623 TaxID=3364875 RepID=UPI0036F4D06A
MTEKTVRRPVVPPPRPGGAGDLHAGAPRTVAGTRFAAVATASDAGETSFPLPGSAATGEFPPRRWSCAGRGWGVMRSAPRPQGRGPALTDVIRRPACEHGAAWHGAGRPGPHPHAHGAGPGVREVPCLRCGGRPGAETGEDHAPVASPEAGGHRVLRTGHLPFLTSARPAARARGGRDAHAGTLAAPVRQPGRRAAGTAGAMTADGAGGGGYS